MRTSFGSVKLVSITQLASTTTVQHQHTGCNVWVRPQTTGMTSYRLRPTSTRWSVRNCRTWIPVSEDDVFSSIRWAIAALPEYKLNNVSHTTRLCATGYWWYTIITIGVTTVQKVGGRSEARRSKPERLQSGSGVLGEESASPLPMHQLGSLGEHCKLPQRGLGQSPEKNWILVYFGTKFCRFHFLSGQILGGRITLASPALWFLGRRVPPPVFTPMIITYGIILFNTTRFWFSVIQLQALESIVQSKGDC